MASYRVELTRSAEKDLRKITPPHRETMLDALEKLAFNPRPHGCRKILGAEQTYRIRVGDYRIVYEIHDEVLVILVIRLAHRKDVYR